MLNKPSDTEKKSSSILLNCISLYFCSLTSHERGWGTLNSTHMEARGGGIISSQSTVQFLGGQTQLPGLATVRAAWTPK